MSSSAQIPATPRWAAKLKSDLQQFFQRSGAERFGVSETVFARILVEVGAKYLPATADAEQARELLGAVHLEELALARGCAAGNEAAWEVFLTRYREKLYDAARGITREDATARELADSLYADLYGLSDRDGQRRSLFRYYHGRSSLTTWLRAVLAQRYVDRLRTGRRVEPLPEEDSAIVLRAPSRPMDPNRDRYLELMRAAMKRATAALPARDRLRLACYYAQELTLAQTGKVLGEHEGTVSRGLARTRAAIRKAVEHDLADMGVKEAEIAQCFESVSEDAGPLSVHDLLENGAAESARKETVMNRSK